MYEKRDNLQPHTLTFIDISAEFSQTLKYGVEGGRKCFLTFLACLPKNELKKEKTFWCYFIVWMPPPQHEVTYSLCPTPYHPNPSPTHSLSTLSPVPHLPFFPFFCGGRGEGGWSVPLQAMLNHQGCVHLCALITCDRWRRLVFNDAPSRFLPISLRYRNGTGTWWRRVFGGRGVGCKRLANWCRVSAHDKPWRETRPCHRLVVSSDSRVAAPSLTASVALPSRPPYPPTSNTLPPPPPQPPIQHSTH